MIRRILTFTAALLGLALYIALSPSPARAMLPAEGGTEDPPASTLVWENPPDEDLLALADATDNAPPEDPDYVAPTEEPTAEPEPTDVWTGDGCTLNEPWDAHTDQADDDCDGTSNVCEDVPDGSYDAVVARGYGTSGDYCVPTKHGLLLPPFPSCVTNTGADDYDCDGTADYYRP